MRTILLKLSSGYLFLRKKGKKQKFKSLPYRILRISFENFKEIKCLWRSRLALLALLPNHLGLKFWRNLLLSKIFLKKYWIIMKPNHICGTLGFSVILEELHFRLVLVPFRKSSFFMCSSNSDFSYTDREITFSPYDLEMTAITSLPTLNLNISVWHLLLFFSSGKPCSLCYCCANVFWEIMCRPLGKHS